MVLHIKQFRLLQWAGPGQAVPLNISHFFSVLWKHEVAMSILDIELEVVTRHANWKEGIKPPLFAGDVTVYIENLKGFTKTQN